MAKTAAERKREQRLRDKCTREEGLKDRLEAVIDWDISSRFKAYLDYKGMTQSEVLEGLIEKWLDATMQEGEAMKVAEHLLAKREAMAEKAKGDTRTMSLFEGE